MKFGKDKENIFGLLYKIKSLNLPSGDKAISNYLDGCDKLIKCIEEYGIYDLGEAETQEILWYLPELRLLARDDSPVKMEEDFKPRAKKLLYYFENILKIIEILEDFKELQNVEKHYSFSFMANGLSLDEVIAKYKEDGMLKSDDMYGSTSKDSDSSFLGCPVYSSLFSETTKVVPDFRETLSGTLDNLVNFLLNLFPMLQQHDYAPSIFSGSILLRGYDILDRVQKEPGDMRLDFIFDPSSLDKEKIKEVLMPTLCKYEEDGEVVLKAVIEW